MKILDETGAVVENPDLTLGYLTTSTEEVTHPAVEGVEEQWHWETVTEYPNGGKDVQTPSPNRTRSRPATPPKSWLRRKKSARNRKQRTSCRSSWTRWKPQTTILF